MARITLNAGKKESVKKVTFQLYAPQAKDVKLAGSFNSWDSRNTTMKRSKEGLWEKDLTLRTGRYEYKFIVDGQWIKDPRNNKTVSNTMGSENSVIEV